MMRRRRRGRASISAARDAIGTRPGCAPTPRRYATAPTPPRVSEVGGCSRRSRSGRSRSRDRRRGSSCSRSCCSTVGRRWPRGDGVDASRRTGPRPTLWWYAESFPCCSFWSRVSRALLALGAALRPISCSTAPSIGGRSGGSMSGTTAGAGWARPAIRHCGLDKHRRKRRRRQTRALRGRPLVGPMRHRGSRRKPAGAGGRPGERRRSTGSTVAAGSRAPQCLRCPCDPRPTRLERGGCR